MEPNGDRQQDNRWARQGIDSLPTRSSVGDANATEGRNAQSAASEVMGLVIKVTRTSADIYELVAAFAKCFVEAPIVDMPSQHPSLQTHVASLNEITAAIQDTVCRIRVFESETVNRQPEIFDAVLEDCWAALATFTEVVENLAGITGVDGNSPPAVTSSETLIQIMKRLETCSENIAGLPGVSMAISIKILSETAFDRQCRSREVVRKSVGSH